MRILLFGRNGQIGWELQRSLAPLGEVIAVDRPEVDFTDLKGLREFTLKVKPGLIVNAAAYTAVDKAESEPALAMRVNGEAPGVLAETALTLGIGLVHYSTDYVFDGEKSEPYTEQDEPNPLSVYGATKLAGDRAIQDSGCAHLILRTSWVYGARGHNFFLTILGKLQAGEALRVVDDQVGCPTWSRAVAGATARMLEQLAGAPEGMAAAFMERGGLYHYSAAGETSWYGFARAIAARAARDGLAVAGLVEAIRSEALATPARRPAYSSLASGRVGQHLGVRPEAWETQLDRCWSGLDGDENPVHDGTGNQSGS